jgi:prepilin-type N-terminal cleavage/methylation domain-containing protein
MMKQRGFTLIELMIVIVVILTVIMAVANVINGTGAGNTVSWGINGITESRCIDGYKFVVGEHGQARQVMDELGRGVKCQ